MTEDPFRMVVDDVFNLPERGVIVITGRVESGSVRAGDRIELRDAAGTCETTIVAIEMHGGGLVLRGVDRDDLRPGQVVTVRTPGADSA